MPSDSCGQRGEEPGLECGLVGGGVGDEWVIAVVVLGDKALLRELVRFPGVGGPFRGEVVEVWLTSHDRCLPRHDRPARRCRVSYATCRCCHGELG
jgi:hypothetical protein